MKLTRLSCHRFRANEVRLWLSLITYNLGNLCRAAGAADEGRHLVADQLAAATGENRRTLDQARTLLLAAAGGEPSDPAAVCRHAAEDRSAAVAGGIRRAQSGADFDDDARAQGKVSAEPFGKRASPGVACPADAKSAPPGAAGNSVDQNRLKPCRERSSGLYGSWNRRVKTEIPDNLRRQHCVILNEVVAAAWEGQRLTGPSDSGKPRRAKCAALQRAMIGACSAGRLRGTIKRISPKSLIRRHSAKKGCAAMKDAKILLDELN